MPLDANPQPASSQRQQKLHNSRSKTPIKTQLASGASDASLGDYRDAPWFAASEGDLFFAQWLLGRCNGVGDASTPQSLASCGRMFALFKTQRRLRRELAMGSKREVSSAEEAAEEGESEGEEQEQEAEQEEEPLWPVQEIVEQVGDVLRASRRELLKQQREAEKGSGKLEGALERLVVAEVVDNATELILSRATSEHEPLLRRWIEVLREEATAGEEETVEEKMPEVSPEVDAEAEAEGDDAAAQKSKKREKKEKEKEKKLRTRKGKSKASEETACEQVESFLAFLSESARTQTQAEASMAAAPLEAEKAWTAELQRIVELSSIEPEEEMRRLRVARDIQTVLRREVSKWRHCEVILFGSSLTHYGSRNSDLDMCLLPTGRSGGDNLTPPKEVMGKRQLQHLMDGKTPEDGHAAMADQLRDLRAQVQKGIEKLTQALNTLDRSGKNGDKQSKQRRQLEFFETQMRLLRNAIVAELTKLLGVVEPQSGGNTSGKSAHLKTIIAASRRRTDDLYLLRGILQRYAQCEVRHVIAGARVPIIRFLHTRSGREYECDLCFENVLATRNTPLLRAYASFDERACALGLAVKHWAKQRGISDASMGFLSSYSFVLLSIYYLQVVHVLPNLQDPRLLEQAKIRPQYYNDIDIAFCEDQAVTRAYHEKTAGAASSDLSLTALLLGFFEFYATQFDFAKRVVTVRAPEAPALKLAQWGSRKAKTWRVSIQDPLETGRDLGCVLQFKGQERIIRELRRAHELLARGASFSDDVCAVEKPVGKPAKQKAKQQGDKMNRSYVLTMRSADRELTKETVEVLFRDFQSSFRVGKVVEASTPDPAGADSSSENKNKRWEVELLTQAKNCPSKLAQRTRLDWKAADGRVGRVWLHHQALFATPPCHKCLSPDHATGKCPLEDIGDGAGAGDRGEPRADNEVLQRNLRRHGLQLTLGGEHSGPSKRNDRRKKQHGEARAAHPTDHSKANSKRGVNGKAPLKREPRGDKKENAPVGNTVHRVEAVAAPTPRVEGEGDNASKTAQKKKKWLKRVHHRKRGNSKGDSTSAAT
jgi:DNA polymerase sigma